MVIFIYSCLLLGRYVISTSKFQNYNLTELLITLTLILLFYIIVPYILFLVIKYLNNFVKLSYSKIKEKILNYSLIIIINQFKLEL